jgi:hypothetical protein
MVDRFSVGYDQERHKGKRFATLWYDDGWEDADITFAPLFDTFPWTLKADLIGDIIGLLERERDFLIQDVPDELRTQLGWPVKED